MSRSLIALSATLLIAFGAQFAYAQPGRGMGMDPEQQIKELISSLDVTAEQEPAFREAMAQLNEMRMAGMGGGNRGMRNAQDPDRDASHDEHNAAASGNDAPMPADAGRNMEMMAQRRAEMEEKALALLAPVLSSAQLEKYKELEAARMAQMMSRMRH